MRRTSLICLLFALAICASSLPARAQLVAFPGAEGAGEFSTGGRGGDVYFVTNLNDNGAGSLRNGISTATGARTIVFDVSGTIHLVTDLTVNKSNITIAGQTAPGQGITIADREMHISGSSATPVQNVILQYLRFRTGNTFTQVGNPPTNPTGYEPDSLGVENARNIMIDHVSASWGTDEVLSVTHDSSHVTVQWSTLTEALNLGHPKGPHAYGSLINGGYITYAHNLYADNASRNPRPEGGGDLNDLANTQLDFVNNVIQNPKDRFGYSGDNTSSNDMFTMNYVANYGISGPSTTASSLFVPASTATKIYTPAAPASGAPDLRSFIDTNKDGFVNGAAATGNALISGSTANPITTYTPSATRFDDVVGGVEQLPLVTTYDATHAYIQVLSHAGANFYRDPVDRRVIRNVMNGNGAIINSQADVGGWPTLSSTNPASDINGDGVPDYFALLNGFPANSASNPSIRNTPARDGSGYTYMEKYLQSLTPNALPVPAAALKPLVVRTSFGGGADAFVTENGGASAVSGGNGTATSLATVWDGASGTTDQAIVMRFDLSKIKRGSLTDASLQLTAASAISGSHTFNVYGLEQDATGWNWSESNIQFNGAPGLTFDGNSGTLGLDPANHDIPGILSLGIFTIGATNAGANVSFSNPNLAVFLNLAAYFQGMAQDNLVSLLLEQTNNSSAATFYSKEGNSLLAPSLLMTAQIAPIKGDFNQDGAVDNADIQALLNLLQTGSTAYEAAHGLSDLDLQTIGDFNHDGAVTAADLDGLFNLLTGHGTGNDGPLSVPEPPAVLLLAVGGLLAMFGNGLGRLHRKMNAA
ncbi:MAG TPA: DNRLRE domain-containing protein [Pirellulales bacterium]|jgi:hypothetical protein